MLNAVVPRTLTVFRLQRTFLVLPHPVAARGAQDQAVVVALLQVVVFDQRHVNPESCHRRIRPFQRMTWFAPFEPVRDPSSNGRNLKLL